MPLRYDSGALKLSPRTLPSKFLAGLGSFRLALCLVVILILLTVLGAVVPQENRFQPVQMHRWRAEHAVLTAVLDPLGGFRIFYSWPFIAVTSLLAANTLTCTLRHLRKEYWGTPMTADRHVARAGFLLLHMSLVVLLAGGFWSAATKMDGLVILTEGQEFVERHENYLSIIEGPLRRERHSGRQATLEKIDVRYAVEKRYPTDVSAHVEFQGDGADPRSAEIKFNRPITDGGLAYTLRDDGFSPRLVVVAGTNGPVVSDSFVALQRSGRGRGVEHRDFIPESVCGRRITMTLYPSHRFQDGKPVKTGEAPETPLLVLESEDSADGSVKRFYLQAEQRVTVGNHTFLFAGLRRWAALRVTEDRGYPVVCAALWVGLVGLLLRYLPDMKVWFREGAA